jgi:2-keto-4-pentenoate hydratase/2-oxohepta-3-ene-1,7-dioic acid hydratase in catechol pathway
MKIGTIIRDGKERIAAMTGEEAVDLIEAWGLGGNAAIAPVSLMDIIASPERYQEPLARALESEAGRVALDRVTFSRPIANPGKVVCLALNNSANKDRILSGPRHPALFIKPTSCLIGTGETIVLKPEYGRVHPEPELAVVIGRRGRDIAEDQAYEHVYGYTVMNDLTSPTMRAEDTFHYRAIHPTGAEGTGVRYVETWVSYPGRYKGSDTFGPIGPWIVTRDEISDPHSLTVRCMHRGRLITEDSTGNLTHKIPQVIAFASRYMTLFPGDVIALGTALSSAGGGQAVQTIDLNAMGGPIAVSISGIGTLENPVVRHDELTQPHAPRR